jgi:hypothetical protein
MHERAFFFCCPQQILQIFHSTLPIRAFQWLVTLWIDRTGPTWSRPRYTLSLQMALEQPLLVHTSLMICLQTYVPNTPCQLSLWKETRTTGRKPTIFGRALNFTLFTWGLGSSHIEKFSLRFEPASLEVKGKYANHFATVATTLLSKLSHRLHVLMSIC